MALMNVVKKVTFVVVLDETPTLWTPTSASTITKVGAKSVVVTKAQEKHCSTALLAAASSSPDAEPHCYPADVIFKAAVGNRVEKSTRDFAAVQKLIVTCQATKSGRQTSDSFLKRIKATLPPVPEGGGLVVMDLHGSAQDRRSAKSAG
jgi:hypothetical protein